MFKELYKKSIELAAHKSSKFFLAIISFIESFIFPIPPDVLIIPMTIAKRHEWYRIALIAISAILYHSCLFAIVIGMINTSGGIGKIKLSINDIIARKNFELLCAANSIDFLYSSLNIFSFIIINVLILLLKSMQSFD